jgi:hypothetical protein
MQSLHRNTYALVLGTFALPAWGCSANAPPGDEVSSDEPAEVTEALSAKETIESMQTLETMGWTASNARRPRVERAGDGEWAVAIPMERGDDGETLDLVYAAAGSKPDAAPMALVRLADARARTSFALAAASVPATSPGKLAAELACAPGCDSESGACVDWSCSYTSFVGLSFGCRGFNDPFGVFHAITRRQGHTDPSRCATAVLDVFGQPHSCPSPASTTNLFACGWP